MFKDFGSGKGIAEPREVSFVLAGEEFHCVPVLSATAWNEGLLAIASSSGVMAVAMQASLIRKSVLHDCSICRSAGLLVPITRIEDDDVKVSYEPDDYQRFVNLIDGDTEIESSVIDNIFEWLWGSAYTERPTDGPPPSQQRPEAPAATSTDDSSSQDTTSQAPSPPTTT
jgi:hypothetical protein